MPASVSRWAMMSCWRSSEALCSMSTRSRLRSSLLCTASLRSSSTVASRRSTRSLPPSTFSLASASSCCVWNSSRRIAANCSGGEGRFYIKACPAAENTSQTNLLLELGRLGAGRAEALGSHALALLKPGKCGLQLLNARVELRLNRLGGERWRRGRLSAAACLGLSPPHSPPPSNNQPPRLRPGWWPSAGASRSGGAAGGWRG